MKKVRNLFLLLSLSMMAFAYTACGSTAPDDQADKAYTADYVCPMHCAGSGSDEAGTCPICKMDYVAKADHMSDGHKHGGK